MAAGLAQRRYRGAYRRHRTAGQRLRSGWPSAATCAAQPGGLRCRARADHGDQGCGGEPGPDRGRAAAARRQGRGRGAGLPDGAGGVRRRAGRQLVPCPVDATASSWTCSRPGCGSLYTTPPTSTRSAAGCRSAPQAVRRLGARRRGADRRGRLRRRVPGTTSGRCPPSTGWTPTSWCTWAPPPRSSRRRCGSAGWWPRRTWWPGSRTWRPGSAAAAAPAQEAVLSLIGTGDLERHVRRMRHEYARRREAMTAVLGGGDAGRAGPAGRLLGEEAGMHMVLRTGRGRGTHRRGGMGARGGGGHAGPLFRRSSHRERAGARLRRRQQRRDHSRLPVPGGRWRPWPGRVLYLAGRFGLDCAVDDDRLKRHDLDDAEWVRLEPSLPRHPRQGHRWNDHRLVIDGIFRTRAGCPWRDLPERFGNWKTWSNRHRRWSGDGTWEMILDGLPALRRGGRAGVDGGGGCDGGAGAPARGWCPRQPPADIDPARLAPAVLSAPGRIRGGGE